MHLADTSTDMDSMGPFLRSRMIDAFGDNDTLRAFIAEAKFYQCTINIFNINKRELDLY
jgi:hypothetical protein